MCVISVVRQQILFKYPSVRLIEALKPSERTFVNVYSSQNGREIEERNLRYFPALAISISACAPPA